MTQEPSGEHRLPKRRRLHSSILLYIIPNKPNTIRSDAIDHEQCGF